MGVQKDDLSGADIKAVCTEAGLLCVVGAAASLLTVLSLFLCDPRSCSALRERRMKITQEDLRKAKDKALYRKKGNEPQVRERPFCLTARMRPAMAPHPSFHAGHVPLSSLCNHRERSLRVASGCCTPAMVLGLTETTGRFWGAETPQRARAAGWGAATGRTGLGNIGKP